MGTHVHQHKLTTWPARLGLAALMLLVVRAPVRPADPKPPGNPMLTIARHLRRAMSILDANTKARNINCQSVLKKLSHYVKKSAAECRRARKRLDKMSRRARARARAGSERAIASIMGRYSNAVVRFDSACPKYSHQLEEIVDELVAGPGQGPSHHRHDGHGESEHQDHEPHTRDQRDTSSPDQESDP